jgi:predicted DNA-binding transcriptional regulator YafY
MRADRLLSLMLILQSKGHMTADALAQRLEVSERTIYRDIDALSTAGVPIYTQSGTNGGVFLDEHYRVSLTGLSQTEALSLFVSSNLDPLKAVGLEAAAEQMLLKLFAALPSAHRQEVDHMRQRLYIDPANWFQQINPSPLMPVLQQAVWANRRIRITYRPVEGQTVERLLEPYALIAKVNIWYLAAKEPGGAIHNYRLSRLEQVSVTDAPFERDPGFDLATYWKESCEAFEAKMLETNPPYPATVRVHPDYFWHFEAYLAERYELLGQPDEAGWRTLRVYYESQGEAVARVLGLGAGIEALEPLELPELVKATARSVLDFYEQR